MYFACHGRINEPLSKGTNDLIKEGAILMTSANDVLMYFEERIDVNQKCDLSDNEKNIYNVLGTHNLTIDEIALKSKMNISDVSQILFELEMKDLVVALSGERYERK